ncbi:hypothetical protein BDQ17DRAFT_1432769 [Cyathus striatus]|nr:hypothetical protein BDQ17DRAFT_1432769 [Cyathus striatus]
MPAPPAPVILSSSGSFSGIMQPSRPDQRDVFRNSFAPTNNGPVTKDCNLPTNCNKFMKPYSVPDVPGGSSSLIRRRSDVPDHHSPGTSYRRGADVRSPPPKRRRNTYSPNLPPAVGTSCNRDDTTYRYSSLPGSSPVRSDGDSEIDDESFFEEDEREIDEIDPSDDETNEENVNDTVPASDSDADAVRIGDDRTHLVFTNPFAQAPGSSAGRPDDAMASIINDRNRPIFNNPFSQAPAPCSDGPSHASTAASPVRDISPSTTGDEQAGA